ncbi:hypothetical protein JMJ55_15590 [Belnapia sp. T6]|uniref:Uncharacterized protein n=1 Tax=Belnapia mucosa TaxID=2804532 RepID=A0ABS1V516_9PROT|nr:hypothetical protein [Belnapia mucosa]MBL6456759.1 hypothetical protein [Belnapia mucosa]
MRQPPRPGSDAPFIADSDLAAMIRGMISSNTLAAFTAQVAPARPAQPVRGPAVPAGPSAATQAQPVQRGLEAVPAAPARPPPRGSLLDLRV